MFNLATLKQLEADVGTEVLAQLISVFCQESAKLTEQLMACTELNSESVRLCHSLKSCARSYGADKLADFAEKLEIAAKSNSQDFFSQRAKLPELHRNTLAAVPRY